MPKDLVTIAQFEFLPEANAAQMFLESEGIQSFILDGELVTNSFFLAAAVNFIKLQVPNTQAEAALLLLAKLQANRQEAKEVDTENPEAGHCLACNALLGEDQLTCPACGWSYADDQEEVTQQDLEDRQAIHGSTSTVSASKMSSLSGLRRMVFLVLIIGMFLTVVFLGFKI